MTSLKGHHIYYEVSEHMWGFPTISGTFGGLPVIRTIVIGVYIGVPLFEKLPRAA